MVRRLNLDGDTGAVQTAATPTVADPVSAPPTFAPPPPAPTFTVAAPPVVPSQPPVLTKAASVPAAPRPKMPITYDGVSNVGADSKGQLATITTRLANEAKLSDMEDMGKLLSDTMLAAKGYNPDNLFKSGFLGFFKAKKDQIAMRFDSVEGVVNKLIAQVDAKAQREKVRSGELEQMRIANEAAAQALLPQYEYLEQVADWMDANKPVAIDGDMESAQYLNDWIMVAGFARKRGDDLRRSKIFMHQQSAIMGGMRQNAINLAQTLGDLKETSIPTLKTSFVLYVQNMEQKKSAEFSDSVQAMTNEAARKNAEALGQNTEQITRAVNRSNYDLATLQASFDAVAKSIDTAARITAEEAERRKTELPQIAKLGEDLTKKLAAPASA